MYSLLQMRARNEFIAGDWSKAIVIEPDIGKFLEIQNRPGHQQLPR